ncbi:VOC family protein, partial [Corallococcus sp. AB038B]
MAQRAIAAGAVLERPIKDEFYGDRVAHIQDPFGHRWSLSMRIEEVSPEEMQRRFLKMVGG